MSEREYLNTLTIDGVSTPLSVTAFSGREEIFACHPFLVRIESEDALAAADLMGKTATLRVQFGTNLERVFHGVVTGVDLTSPRHEQAVGYGEIEFAPRLRLLGLGQNSRIFQNRTTKQIVSQLLAEGDIDEAGMQWDIEDGKYEAQPYVVQYNESDLAFVSRLLAADGVGYRIHHDLDSEIVCFFDDSTTFEPIEEIDGSTTLRAHAGAVSGARLAAVLNLRDRRTGSTDGVRCRDYDFTNSGANVETNEEVEGGGGREIYLHPGGFTSQQMDAGERGELVSERILQRVRMWNRRFEGDTPLPFLTAGRTFTIEGHARTDINAGESETALCAVAVDHRYSREARYTNHFVAIPSVVPYRPDAALVPPAPMVGGVQPAFVTVPTEQEIRCDAMGRIDVWFPWDREGEANATISGRPRTADSAPATESSEHFTNATAESTSIAMRVGQLALGGAILIPRIGFEVLVDFELGNMDRPFIATHLYNGKDRPPYELPATNMQTAWQTNTTEQGGGANNFGFNDTDGGEQIFFNASKNMNVAVENNSVVMVTSDENMCVDLDHIVQVGTNLNQNIGGARGVNVHGDQKVNVGQDQSESRGGNDSRTIGGAESAQVGGDLLENTKGTFTRTVGALQNYVGVNGIQRTIQGSSTTTVLGAWLEGNNGGRLVSCANYLETVGALKMIKAKTAQVQCGAAYAQTGVAMDSSCKGRVDTTKGLLSLLSGGGVAVKGKNVVVSAEDKLSISAGGCSIELASSGTVTVKAGSNLDLRGAKGINNAIHKAGG